MGLKVRIHWFNKLTEFEEGKEYSADLEENGTVIEAIGLPLDGTINHGLFDVVPAWVPILQSYFEHRIDLNTYFYQVGFSYRERW